MLAGFDMYIGPAAGLATSCLWTGTSLFFTAAGRRLGATVVNGSRIAVAILLLGITHRLLAGVWVPQMVAGQVLFLAASGVVGLSLGDQALFTAFVSIGPRLSMLIMTTAPIFAALFGWLALGETLRPVAWVAMGLTIGGVAWVVLERPYEETGTHGRRRVRGVLLALVAAACQAGGLWLSKQGMGHGWLPQEQRLDPQAATLVRMCFAGVGMVPIMTMYHLRRRRRLTVGVESARVGSRRAGLVFAACGAVVGPFLGVWMSLVASDRAPLGVAQTLCSLPPVLLLPVVVLVYKERVSMRAVIGAVIAVSGTALLFFKPQ